MQNRYAGDVGDFGKFGLLRYISISGLRIGLNWYLVPDETHNNDGKHIGYLKNKKITSCDEEISNAFARIVDNGNRNIESLENANLIPKMVYYKAILYPPKRRDDPSRAKWHAEALQALANVDLVVLDPDNGLLVKSVSPGSRKSNKYVFLDELADYFQGGQSVVFYNHRPRANEKVYLERFRKLKEMPVFQGAGWLGLKFKRGSLRDYFFILQPEHVEVTREAVFQLMDSSWGDHFSWLDI